MVRIKKSLNNQKVLQTQMGTFSKSASTTGKLTSEGVKAGVSIWTKIGWRGVITILLILIIAFHAITEGIAKYRQTKEVSDIFMPFLWEVGGRLISADEYIFQTIETLKNNPDSLVRPTDGSIRLTLGRVWDKIYLFFDVFSNIWFIYINLMIFYWLWLNINGKDETGKNLIFAILSLFMIQALFSSVLLNASLIKGEVKVEAPEETSKQELFRIVGIRLLPFKGIVSMALYLPTLFDGISGSFVGSKSGLNQSEV